MELPLPWEKRSEAPASPRPSFVVAWSLEEPERLGERILVERACVLGRGLALADDPAPRAWPMRVRPGEHRSTTPLAATRLSRTQLLLRPSGERAISVTNLGRCVLRLNGRPVTEATVTEGDVLELHNALVLYVAGGTPSTPARLPSSYDGFGFGQPDPFGLVGESEAAWRLREALAFASGSDRHVLLLGETGVGKELAARAVHGLSARAGKPLVSRNAATFPEGLVDAELFGNVKNYPNVGSPERPGLFGEANGGTLFLDEIGDLPTHLQVHLLRVLDGGEYQRLGEAKPRRGDVRLVAATNRPLESLKHDFLARFTHRIQLPSLTARREDLPLVLRELLLRAAQGSPAVADRFFERRAGRLAEPRLAPSLVVRLLRHRFEHNVRELDRLVWLAMSTAQDDYLGVTSELETELVDDSPGEIEVDRAAIERAIASADGNVTRAAASLGLKNRYALYRLMRRLGMETSDKDESQ